MCMCIYVYRPRLVPAWQFNLRMLLPMAPQLWGCEECPAIHLSAKNYTQDLVLPSKHFAN